MENEQRETSCGRGRGLLVEVGRTGALELRNRLVRSATAERLADEREVPPPELLSLHVRLARSGVGLIVLGHMYVSSEGKAHPGMTRIASADSVEPLQNLVEAVHQEGAVIAVQLNHAGMKTAADVDRSRAPSEDGPPLADRPAIPLREAE